MTLIYCFPARADIRFVRDGCVYMCAVRYLYPLSSIVAKVSIDWHAYELLYRAMRFYRNFTATVGNHILINDKNVIVLYVMLNP